MGNYALVSDIQARLIPFREDNILFSDEKIEEVLDAVEVDIDSAILARGYTSVPLTGARDVILLKQKVIDGVIGELLLQRLTSKDDPNREMGKVLYDRFRA